MRRLSRVKNEEDKKVRKFRELVSDVANSFLKRRKDISIKLKEYMPDDIREEYKELYGLYNLDYLDYGFNIENYTPNIEQELDFYNLRQDRFAEIIYDNKEKGKKLNEAIKRSNTEKDKKRFDLLRKINDQKNHIIKEDISLINSYYYWEFASISMGMLSILYYQKIKGKDNSEIKQSDLDNWKRYKEEHFYSGETRIQFIKIGNEIIDDFKKQITKEEDTNLDYFNLPTEEFPKGRGFVYLIRNEDIFKIGVTINLIKRMAELKPDEIIDVVKCSNYEKLERSLHKLYKNERIPQTEYFRLTKEQLETAQKIMKQQSTF